MENERGIYRWDCVLLPRDRCINYIFDTKRALQLYTTGLEPFRSTQIFTFWWGLANDVGKSLLNICIFLALCFLFLSTCAVGGYL